MPRSTSVFLIQNLISSSIVESTLSWKSVFGTEMCIMLLLHDRLCRQAAYLPAYIEGGSVKYATECRLLHELFCVRFMAKMERTVRWICWKYSLFTIPLKPFHSTCRRGHLAMATAPEKHQSLDVYYVAWRLHWLIDWLQSSPMQCSLYTVNTK
jgi:hypothetical protein